MANIVKAWAWQCQECQRECVPIRAESRCMCGHRLKEHTEGHKCSNRSCSCPKFSFIVAEGSWILRCRCKHKHTEHDPSSHACSKASCSCSGFTSPWVCNCDHPWTQHQQVLVERQVLRLSDMLAQAQQAAASNLEEPGAKQAASAAAAAAAEGSSLSLQEVHRSSSSTNLAASAAAEEKEAAVVAARTAVRSLQDKDAENVNANNNSSSSSSSSKQAGRLSGSTLRLQQLQQRRHHQAKEQHVPAGTPGCAAVPSGMERKTAAVAGGTSAAAVSGASSVEQLLAAVDLECDVNRWDLLQRGVSRTG